jgi:serine/threonine-protein kinase
MLKRLFRLYRKYPRISWTLTGLLLLFLTLNYVALPIYVNHGSRLSVPRVVGLTVEEASAQLSGSSLVPVQAETRPDPNHPAGVVVYQNPLPGAVVKEGRRVYLTVSGGEIMVPVPLLRGKSLRDARFALERQGLRLGAIAYDFSETFPENTIIDQTVQADARVTKGKPVGVTVSKGKGDQEIAIPNVVGKTLTEAERALKGVGLKIGIVTAQPSFDLLPNTVVDQFPRAGETGKAGQEIDLFIVKAGRPTEEIKRTPRE